ncbi:MAG: hypothetical protein KAS07_02500 [Candidatus Pacebacteria bacterium]|nr:hypothetical protein [Candidatus Paceibacterota bacterium]
MTPRTELFDKLANPFFTHSAFYFGDSKIVEAIGTEKNPQDDIQITTLSKSDWLNSDIDNFIIIRPKNYSQKLAIIKNNLENIAEDPDYTFGLPKQGHKKTTCADIIFQQLLTEKVVQISNPPKIITPDYLFWLTNDNPNKFKIIGYNFQE